ncbi:MAG: hypothetical protein KBG85_02635 [Micropruina sp.]|nr:hypothetical protein [Micropruina sp.]
MTWTTPADIAAKLRRRWDDGSLLRAYAAREPFPRVEVPLRGPRASEIGERLGEVQRWVGGLVAGSRDGSCFTLEYASIGGRLIGRNQLPRRAILESYNQAWRLLGVRGDVAAYDGVLAETADEPVLREWVGGHPLVAVELAGEWPRLIAAYRWLDANRGSGRYLREITAPGVDTKFAERHRVVLSKLLGVPATRPGFLGGLGLKARPEFVRFRPAPELGPLGSASELAVRTDELPSLEIGVRAALVVENEISYLSVPVPAGGVVIWGKGFDVDRVGALPWLRSAAVTYWGDLDTHGFAILDRLRAWLPQTRSVLMDRDTLLGHRERWGTEDSPTSARLRHLTSDEYALYTDLVEDRYAEKLRLEQERIDWTWAADRLG